MNNTYAYFPPSRILLCTVLVIMAILCLVSIFRSQNTIQALKEERTDFADEFLILYRTNRIFLFSFCVILIIYLLVGP